MLSVGKTFLTYVCKYMHAYIFTFSVFLCLCVCLIKHTENSGLLEKEWANFKVL